MSGTHFPGLVSFSEGISFDDISKLTPLEQWSALPTLGKAQILLAIGIIEHQSEWKIKPHYVRCCPLLPLPLPWQPMHNWKSLWRCDVMLIPLPHSLTDGSRRHPWLPQGPQVLLGPDWQSELAFKRDAIRNFA